MFKVNNKGTRTKSLMLSGVFVVNNEHISHLFLVFVNVNLSIYLFAGILQGACNIPANNQNSNLHLQGFTQVGILLNFSFHVKK